MYNQVNSFSFNKIDIRKMINHRKKTTVLFDEFYSFVKHISETYEFDSCDNSMIDKLLKYDINKEMNNIKFSEFYSCRDCDIEIENSLNKEFEERGMNFVGKCEYCYERVCQECIFMCKNCNKDCCKKCSFFCKECEDIKYCEDCKYNLIDDYCEDCNIYKNN